MLFRSDSLKSNDSLMHENDLENFKVELENERKFRDNAAKRNKDIEASIVKLQEELQKSDYPWEHESELADQIRRVEELTLEIKELKKEIPELKHKMKNAKPCGKDCKMKHDNLNINLDIMNEVELIKTIKRLERMRTDLKSALISKEWQLDNESKSYTKILDQKAHMQSILYNNNVTPPKKITPRNGTLQKVK